jgi:hypothetical protein
VSDDVCDSDVVSGSSEQVCDSDVVSGSSEEVSDDVCGSDVGKN